jgi:hypothetical protein
VEIVEVYYYPRRIGQNSEAMSALNNIASTILLDSGYNLIDKETKIKREGKTISFCGTLLIFKDVNRATINVY